MHTDSRSKSLLLIAYFTATQKEAEEFSETHTKLVEERIPIPHILIIVHPRKRTGIRLIASCGIKQGRKSLLATTELLIHSSPPNERVIIMHP